MTSTEATRAYRARRRAAGLPTNTPRQQAQIGAWLAETYRRLRQEVMDLLGYKCAWCGTNDTVVLEMDHRENDGAADRRRFKGGRSMLTYYSKHKAEAKRRLQLLCRNCNWRKRKGYGGPS